MIFSSLFRPKHQDPKAQVRIKAISQLSADEPQQKSVLHELAFNDPDANVSLAALTKLDSFVLWYKMAEIAKNEQIQKRSQQVVEQILLSEQSDKMNPQEKRAFIVECKDSKLLQKLLGQTWLQKEPELVLGILATLDKPQLTVQTLLASHDTQLQLELLSQFEDEATLNKVLKKVSSEQVKLAARNKLQTLQANKQIPIEVTTKTRLVLARLLALKECHDLPKIQSQRAELVTKYEELAKEFTYLSISEKQNFIDKFADIEHKLNTLVVRLQPAWEAEQSALKQQEATEQAKAQAQEVLQDISTELRDNIQGIGEQQAQQYEQQLMASQQQIESLLADLADDPHQLRRSLEKLNMQLRSCQNTLHSIPAFQQAIEFATNLLNKFSALPLPNDLSQTDAASQYLQDMQQQWQELTHTYQVHWPQNLMTRWQAQSAKWQQAIKALQGQLTKDVERCRNKLRAVDTLVSQGKFKGAMGLYQKVLIWYQGLPEKQQAQLQRSFVKVQEQIENLKDWQEYIATPRKPVLLNEAEALISAPLAIDEQAIKIKILRQQWSSLGKLDNEADQALNQAFEATIEQAFAPCREFYVKQEQQREVNLIAKRRLIESLAELSEKLPPEADAIKQVRVLQQQWKTLGEVDYKQREALNQQYHERLTPIKERINQYYQDNAAQKQHLLEQARLLIDLDSVADAIAQAKRLQDKWKTIQHAGKKAEADLWPAFRATNDQVFARLKSQQQQDKQALDDQIEQANTLLMAMADEISTARDKGALAKTLVLQSEISALLADLPSRAKSTLEQLFSQNIQAHQDKLREFERNQKIQQYTNLLLALSEWTEVDTLPEVVQHLPGVWQQCFKNVSISPELDRHGLTIVMEIISQTDSPESDAARRKELQLQLMAEKLQQGVNRSLQERLKEWIRLGPLDKTDTHFLKRLEDLMGDQLVLSL